MVHFPFVDLAGGRTLDRVTVVLAALEVGGREAARIVALRAAAAVLGVPLTSLRIDHEPSGRPVLGGAGGTVFVSVSHARGLVAFALTRLVPVGVDVEPVRPLEAVRLSRRWFRPEEATWVEEQPCDERDRAFLWLWTHKEAVGKARGVGLNEGGLRYAVPLPAGSPDDHAGASCLVAVAGDPDVAVAAPVVSSGVMLAVAGHGRAAAGAAVDVVRHEVAADD